MPVMMLGQRLVGVAGDELGAVVVGVGRPRLDETLEVADEEVAHHGEVLRPPVGVVGGRVVGDRAFARGVGGEVLAPEQELDGVPTRRDVGFAALLVERGHQLGVDRRDRSSGSLITPARRVAVDVVDVRLVERPGVDQALRAGLGVVDRPAVEAERLGRSVVVACREPRLLRRLQRHVGRVGDEGVDRRVELLRRGQAGAVRAVHAGRVVLDGVLLQVGVGTAVVVAAGGEPERCDEHDTASRPSREVDAA